MKSLLPVTTCLVISALLPLAARSARSEPWPGWRGPQQNGVSVEKNLPLEWSPTRGIIWCTPIGDEGSSSPIIWQEHVFVTSATRGGDRRFVQAFDRNSGELLWKRELSDENPEFSSPLTGHAASTPVTDGENVYAWFGNAGLVCFDFAGNQKWIRQLGQFETELGVATSPVVYNNQLLLLCDHDGDRFRSFDSFLIALDKHNGQTLWSTDRPGQFRSWTTPLVRPKHNQLIVSGDKQLRSYDLTTGKLQWHVDGLLEWVAPTPAAADELIIAMCGRNGPILAVNGAENDHSKERLLWQHAKGGAYVSSPLLYQGRLYIHSEQGILTCYDLKGNEVYQQRLEGTFYGSAVAADGYIYITNDQGTTFVLRAGPQFELVSRNELNEEVLSSPAISGGSIFLRTSANLYRIGRQE